MTTVAYKDGILASDSRAIYNYRDIEVVTSEKAKMFKMPDGSYMGLAGTIPNDPLVFEAIKQDLYTGEMDMDFIRVRKNGLFIRGGPNWNEKCKFPFKFCAIGSGMHFAMGAMSAGASAEEAVKVAMKFDRCTGGKIRVMQCEF